MVKVHGLEDVLNHLKSRKQFLYDRYGVLSIGVFGSFANENQTTSSDVDIVIEIEKGKKNLHNFLEIKRLLENDLERCVDLGFFHTLKPIVREKIKGKIKYV